MAQRVEQAIARALVGAGVRQVFGVVGSGNFHLTNEMIAAGARFVAARHEGGAATMADAYARVSGDVAAISLHQGCGYTNALTGIAEAAKSRTPLVVLAPLATHPGSNFRIDQAAIAVALGAETRTLADPATAAQEAADAVSFALSRRRTVVLNLPLPILESEATGVVSLPDTDPTPHAPDPGAVTDLADVLNRAQRPVFIVGRGGRAAGARDAILQLAERAGALVATSAVAAGLFEGHRWNLGISGGFSSPTAAELIGGADLLVGWGCSLNMWTMRHGKLIGAGTVVAQVDDDPDALGRHREVHVPVLGDVALTAAALLPRITGKTGYRSAETDTHLAGGASWREVPFEDTTTADRIDPRTLSLELDRLLPPERIVSVDSGNFMGYPSAYLQVPDEAGFCFTQAFQSIGLGLATAIGAALARPDRLPVAALGDGGALMGAAEFETLQRLGLPMVVVIYNDDAYGAEVHHFHGEPLETVTFPPADLAAVARGYGLEAITVRGPGDLSGLRSWLAGPRQHALVVDAKVTSAPSWWLAEAFGH